MNRISYTLTLFAIVLILSGCTKEDAPIVLNEDYLQVADALQYCQGSCTETLLWEGNEILLKGHIPNIEDDSVMQDYYAGSRFYLSDIRNGMFLEVRVEGEKDAVFEILYTVSKQDMVFIRGTAESLIVNEGNECLKGLIIELVLSEDIKINL